MALVTARKVRSITIRFAHSSVQEPPKESDEFRVLDLRANYRVQGRKQQKFVKLPPPPPRELRMSVDQDWPSVWPGPRSFHPASVPLPLRQGWYQYNIIPPGKYANAELMKLPNFLHLTPPAIERHCKAIKKFCTPWPKGLDTEEQCEKHFPLEVTTTDYCHSSPKIRDPKSRIVTFKFRINKFALDHHANDKITRLLGERLDEETGVVTLVTDRCPLRRQNYEYNRYLLLALYYESWKVEDWEAEKCEEDYEVYDWDRNKVSKKAYINVKNWPKPVEEIDCDSVCVDGDEVGMAYKESVTELYSNGESIESLFNYKEAVKKLVLGR